MFPAIAVTGRLSTDALGVMTQGETIVQAGGGAQTGASRWGDYSTLNIDPVDGKADYNRMKLHALISAAFIGE